MDAILQLLRDTEVDLQCGRDKVLRDCFDRSDGKDAESVFGEDFFALFVCLTTELAPLSNPFDPGRRAATAVGRLQG